ncbi:19497_t:CDS:2 [Funneliformis geosporum]|uniref:19497_t:CDS:1 n=1 Tax=Funneliformis geosporum TaxID=1117311 RepID=A0A9W4T6A3_9GLOM|nr:19497_t:CDS:2 [Funneliformis geosporum]
MVHYVKPKVVASKRSKDFIIQEALIRYLEDAEDVAEFLKKDAKKEEDKAKESLKKIDQLMAKKITSRVESFLAKNPTEYGKPLTGNLKAGLRITEAISFDLNLEHGETEYKGLYLLRGKRQKESANRIVFFAFLKQIKKELDIAENIELAPHTLRRCFATYNALNGMPLPVLQKVLGHSKISTTALYIKDSDLRRKQQPWNQLNFLSTLSPPPPDEKMSGVKSVKVNET